MSFPYRAGGANQKIVMSKMWNIFRAVVELVDSGTGPNDVPRDLCRSASRWVLGPDHPVNWGCSSGYRVAGA